jgi:DNA/RNA endonuclease YhcR with UshA esterase domain
MKNSTIVILKKGEGEYDSYQEDITDVYIVRRKKFNVESEYNHYLFKRAFDLLLPFTLKEENNFYHITLGVKLNKEQKKIWKKIIEFHTIHFFLENVIKAKKCNSTSEYLWR